MRAGTLRMRISPWLRDLFRRKLFICLIIVLLILRTAPKQTLRNGKKASAGMSVLWAVAGIWLALFSQGIAGMIEQYVFHVGDGSENTKAILNIIKAMPLMIIVSSIVGPILEEIIFRKIIFGVLYEKTNFFIAGLISSVIFGIVHQDLTHLLAVYGHGLYLCVLVCADETDYCADIRPCHDEYHCRGHAARPRPKIY